MTVGVSGAPVSVHPLTHPSPGMLASLTLWWPLKNNTEARWSERAAPLELWGAEEEEEEREGPAPQAVWRCSGGWWPTAHGDPSSTRQKAGRLGEGDLGRQHEWPYWMLPGALAVRGSGG